MLLSKFKMVSGLVICLFVCFVSAEIIGNQNVGTSSSTTAKRSGQRFEVTENGDINSVTIYHSGTGNQLVVAVYADNNGIPGTLISRSSIHSANTTAGWQTVSLDAAAPITQGTYVWLAWFFENSPGTRYVSGSGWRFHYETWPSGATPEVLMPSSFGSTYSMSRLYSIYANYTPSGGTTYTLATNVSPSSSGTITRNPDKSSYNSGEQVTLTANPAAGYVFIDWSGDASGTANPTNITMNSNKSVTANFAAQATVPPNNWTSNPGTGVTWTNDQVGVGTDQVPAGTMLRVDGTAQANELHAPVMTCTDNTHIMPNWGGMLQLNGGSGNRTWRNDNFHGRIRWYNSDNGWNDERASLTNNGDFDGVALNGRGVFTVAATVTNGVFPVTAFGAIANDGIADDGAFFDALSAANAAGGGVVFVPTGQYRLEGSLTIPAGVALQGTFNAPHDAFLNQGTVLLALANQGDNQAEAFITLNSNSTVAGLTIYYPEQMVPPNQHEYPWTIRGAHGCRNAAIRNVTMANSCWGIDFHFQHERHHIENVNMTVLHTGILVDTCYDIGKGINIHIHNRFWETAANLNPADNAALKSYTFGHMMGFQFRRTDWEYLSNCFVIWANIGMYFNDPGDGDFFSTPSVFLTQSGVDNSRFSVILEKCRIDQGIVATNSDFIGQFVVQPTNEGPIKLVNSRLQFNWDEQGYEQNPIMMMQGDGTLTMSNCFFSWYDVLNNGANAMYVGNGSRVLMTNCEFGCAAQPARNPNTVIGVAQFGRVYATNCRFRSGIPEGLSPALNFTNCLGD